MMFTYSVIVSGPHDDYSTHMVSWAHFNRVSIFDSLSLFLYIKFYMSTFHLFLFTASSLSIFRSSSHFFYSDLD